MMERLLFENLFLEEVYLVQAKTTIIIPHPWSELRQEQRQLLSKILQAVRISLESVRIVHQSSPDLSSWSEKPKRVVAFVPAPKGLPHYEVIQTGEISLVISETLDVLFTSEGSKLKLWNALRTLFTS